MAHIAYLRVSTSDQSVESQRHAMLQATHAGQFDKEFKDEGVSGAIPAAQRPGFAALLSFVREGDTLHVYAVDRLGRDALDVQTTVRNLIGRGVTVDIHGLGAIAHGVGELILAVLAQVADMERNRIKERTAAGRDKARDSLEATGRTHRGKVSMGRPRGTVGKPGQRTVVDPSAVRTWRQANGKSIAETATHWGLSAASVKRYCVASAS
ncbi:MAG: recombinase family protein [Rubrivivax sp.]|nr:recombinase family protein [Rubrivivax sp.]